MKKLFHLAIIGLIVLSATSCSKSAADLQPNQPTTATTAQNAGTSRYSAPGTTVISGIAPEVSLDGPAAIFPIIKQPYDMFLGTSKNSTLHSGSGEEAVFYVLVDPRYIHASTTGLLSLRVSGTGQLLKSFDLISYENAADYNIEVPDGLGDKTYYFAIVNLSIFENYANKYISLQADFDPNMLSAESFGAKMKNAFIYIP